MMDKVTVRNVLTRELNKIHDERLLKELLIDLSALLLKDIKAISAKFTRLEKQMKEGNKKGEDSEQQAQLRFLTIIMSLMVGAEKKSSK